MDQSISDSIIYNNVTIKRVTQKKNEKHEFKMEVEVDPYSMSKSIETVECTPTLSQYQYQNCGSEDNDKIEANVESVDFKYEQLQTIDVKHSTPKTNMRINKRKSVPRKIQTYTMSPPKHEDKSTEVNIENNTEKHKEKINVEIDIVEKDKKNIKVKELKVREEVPDSDELSDNDAEKSHFCEICGEKFLSKLKLTLHLRAHSTEKQYKCTTCGKAFRNPGTLKVHEDLHLGLKPWACTQCEKTYTTKQQLTIHIRSHTGERPFSCKTCQKMFKDKWKLTIHENTHSGLKPFECDKCDKKYTTKYQLTTHYRIHTKDKLFECDTCTKQFTERSKLKLHEKIHLGVKPFVCDLCDKKYLHKSHLKFHIESIHLTVKLPKKKK